MIQRMILFTKHKKIQSLQKSKLQAKSFSERHRKQPITKNTDAHFENNANSTTERGNIFLRPLGRKKKFSTKRNKGLLDNILFYLRNQQKRLHKMNQNDLEISKLCANKASDFYCRPF